MIFSEALDIVSGLRYIADDIELISPSGKRMLYSQPFIRNSDKISEIFDDIDKTIYILSKYNKDVSFIKNKLMSLMDIKGTMNHISNDDVRDDIELFELKRFSLISEDIRNISAKIGLDYVNIPDLSEVVSFLDPDKKRIQEFYIYDSYSQELALLRQKYRGLKKSYKNDEAEEIMLECFKIENTIRHKLSLEIRPYSSALLEALDKLSYIDILIAKSEQIIRLGLIRPKIGKNTSFEGLFNPMIKALLEAKSKRFQSVDISISGGATVITGANMVGKSVLLKTVALSCFLFQFGFYVPASYAEITPVDDIFLSIGDGQNEMNGLSSFGAEMLDLNRMVVNVISGKKLLVLMDEPARTTNPIEGKAIINGLIDFLVENKVMSLITTHYSGILSNCRKLRIRGFIENKFDKELTIKNINEYIDYSLEEDSDGYVPKEALRIAEILGVSDEIMSRIKSYI